MARPTSSGASYRPAAVPAGRLGRPCETRCAMDATACGWRSPSSSAGTGARRHGARRARVGPRPAGPRRRRAGRRGRPPPPAAARAPGRPPIPVRPLPLPRLALYEAWHRAAAAAGRAGDRPGRRRPRHRRGDAAAVGARWWSPSTTWRSCTSPSHFTRHGRALLPPGHRARPPRRRPRDLPVAGDARRLRRATASTPAGCGSCRGASTPTPADADEVAGVRAPATASTGRYVLWVGHGRAAQEPARPCSRRSRALDRHRRRRSCSSGPQGWNEDLGAPLGAGSATGCARSASSPPTTCGPLYAGAEVFCFPSLARGLRPAGARGDGPGHAGGHLGGHRRPPRSAATPALLVDPHRRRRRSPTRSTALLDDPRPSARRLRRRRPAPGRREPSPWAAHRRAAARGGLPRGRPR